MEGRLRSYEFRRERAEAWRELEALVRRVERSGLKRLDATSLATLPLLYRAAVSSLSVARSISLDRNVLEYLESLCARAYICVYAPKRGVGALLRAFVTRRFPETVRRYRRHVGLAAFSMVLGAVVAYTLVGRDVEWYYSFVPDGMAMGRDPTATTEHLRDGLYDAGADDEELAVFSSMLFTHNAGVGMFASALGILAGIPVFLLLFYNGLLLGAFARLYAGRGLAADLWGWLLPHGCTELFAIVLCGAAGLVMAQGFLFPGRQSRYAALVRRGHDAAVLVAGSVALFAAAAVIEGVFRQRVTSIPLRYALAGATSIGGIVYFVRAGRGRA
jgi:uncharacterized membrane protein SpoIIM required for sporulation